MEKFKNGQYYDVPTIEKFIKNACTSIIEKGVNKDVARDVGMTEEHIARFELQQLLSFGHFTIELLETLFEDEEKED